MKCGNRMTNSGSNGVHSLHKAFSDPASRGEAMFQAGQTALLVNGYDKLSRRLHRL
jgi:hypothetical protein